MQYANLGRSGLKVSKLCLGTMNFGPYASQEDSFTIMDTAIEKGINFFDTANVYGWKVGAGATETILGNWFAQGGERREQVVLATKVFGKMGDGPNDRRLSARNIRLACEASLKRLQTEYIDLYQMHHIDRETPWEEIWQAMEQLVRQGKILYCGSSNFAGWQIVQAQEAAKHRNFMGLISEQSLYNLTERTVELEVIPACREYGIGILPWSPLNRGILAGSDRQEENSRRSSNFVQEKADEVRGGLEDHLAFCASTGQNPASVALAWLLHNPDVTAPIIGPRTLDQLNDALSALEVTLDEETLNKLDEIWPGPGGEAPEAYAW